ncbi:lytic transglycosylase domain-containing protein [Simplicispira suum]|uniref:Lytic transglycosylase n=1 Tax=Simplicispira suum TaxID=2109915 RepID=A0A2S0MW08_9BURK|nr:lytic transglycosylase domain-containing protein [Simplicispira suum]AVO40080.1 lytic transglycosylase [Simplicispira suum]MBW7834340.1 lytic transglycosylase domain-containing protein [Simplicispira suum]
MTATGFFASGLRTVLHALVNGIFKLTHNSFALLGLAVACLVITLTARPDLREQGELQLRSWLQARQGIESDADAELDEPSERALAADPRGLPKEQARVAFWLSKKYRVAPEPLSVLVGEAYELGARTKLDPTLILAIVAIESRFNPFAQSPVGAQGLMQVMTRVHTDKYEAVGGQLAAFDPVTNLRVGVQVLQECIRRAGSLEGGLRYYVGAANLESDGGYAAKVLAEHFRLRQVAGGRGTRTATPAPGTLTTKADAPPAAEAPAAPVVAPGIEKVALLSAS